jgi:hypothetical protein
MSVGKQKLFCTIYNWWKKNLSTLLNKSAIFQLQFTKMFPDSRSYVHLLLFCYVALVPKVFRTFRLHPSYDLYK